MPNNKPKEKAPATLPDQAVADLMECMDDSASDEIKGLSLALVFQIPVPASYIPFLCKRLIEMDITPSGISVEELKELKRHWSTQNSAKRIRNSDQMGQRYPLLYGINKFHRKWRKSGSKVKKQAYTEACKLFIATCSVSHDEEIKESQLYEQTHIFRDVLIKKSCEALDPSQNETVDSYRQRTIQFISKLETSDNMELAISLLDGGRPYGSYIRKVDKGYGSFTTDIENHVDSNDAPSSTPYITTETSDPYDEGNPKSTYQRVAGKNGSRITRKDDQRALYYRYQAVGARNNIAITDVHRLTLIGVAGFFEHLHKHGNKLEIAYEFILATCGASEKSLEEMISTDQELPFEKGLIYFRRDSGILFVSLNNGNATWPDFDGNHEQQFMEILLPKEIGLIINRSNDERPFRGIISCVDNQAQQFGVHNAGLTPTARRIKSSFRTLCAPACFKDQFEASFVTGSMPAQYGAKAHYCRFDMAELNEKYQQGVESFVDRLIKFGKMSKELETFLHACCQFDLAYLPTGYIGSRLTADRNEYLEFLKHVRIAFNRKNKSLRWLSGQDQIHCALSLLQHQHLYLYLLIQLLDALRPPGDKTSFAASDHYKLAISKTKDSADYSELNLAPAHSILLAQLQQTETDLDLFTIMMVKHGVPFINYEQDGNYTPLSLTTRKKSGVVVAHRLTASKARSLISDLIVEFNASLQLPFKANNLFRHLNATMLFKDVPEPLLDEYMGHGREGLEIFDEWSTSSFTCYPLLEKAVEKLAEGIAKKPLEVHYHI
ncbi:hypothetical protein Ga0123461_1252 [Mariprofundus aestuarium]|uniref:Uncharacterized protein n=1 Tax=Mariprofundus aestuarium TaxID=1921086 RepID=A0A2K8L1H7_MARES|nr:hypothetical protein [Mariprofundus aestuarium]ATX79671.1 hypothetical protein Ga0123461_1252 [Mariprofundus aestuarium]